MNGTRSLAPCISTRTAALCVQYSLKRTSPGPSVHRPGSADSTTRHSTYFNRQELAGCSHWTENHYLRRYSTSTKLPEATSLEQRADTADGEDLITGMEDVDESEMPDLGEDGILVDQVEMVISSSTAERPRLPKSIKKLNKLLSRHQMIDIPEVELEEKFVRGSGKGGQAVNKTSSSVCLTHLPTGIRVQAQPTRSREQNRTAARHILRDRLDLLRATGDLPGEQGSLNEVEGVQAEGKAAKKAELAKMAGMYAKDELRAAKVRQRKADRAKKHRKKKREEEEEEEGSADKEDRL